MFVNPRIGSQLVKDHQQELLASARQQPDTPVQFPSFLVGGEFAS